MSFEFRQCNNGIKIIHLLHHRNRYILGYLYTLEFIHWQEFYLLFICNLLHSGGFPEFLPCIVSGRTVRKCNSCNSGFAKFADHRPDKFRMSGYRLFWRPGSKQIRFQQHTAAFADRVRPAPDSFHRSTYTLFQQFKIIKVTSYR